MMWLLVLPQGWDAVVWLLLRRAVLLSDSQGPWCCSRAGLHNGCVVLLIKRSVLLLHSRARLSASTESCTAGTPQCFNTG
jgi:hypothetical protein